MLPFPNAIMHAMRALSQSQSSDQQSCQDIQAQLAQIRAELNKEVLDVSEGLRCYTELVDNFYTECPPFGSGSFEADYQDIIELVGHSMVVGSYYLLEKWAVRYPMGQPKPGCLAQPIEQYRITFEQTISNEWQTLATTFGWPPQARAYCEYLIQAWGR